MANMKDEMRQRAWRSILSRAFFSIESAVIVALAIVLFGLGYQPFSWWQPVFWLLFGAAAEALYLTVTVSDPQMARQAVADMLSAQYDPDTIKNPLARDRVRRALEYLRLIQAAAAEHQGAMRVSLDATASEISGWIERIYTLARRLDEFEENEVIARDRRTVPYEIRNLRRQLRNEQSPEVRAELEEALQTKELQLNNLKALENRVKRAAIQLDHTLAALGTIYAQVQIIDARDVDSARARRLQEDIRDEVLSLSETIAAIEEVQEYRVSGSAG